MVSYVPQVREVRICLYVCVCVARPMHGCGCMVDGSNAMAVSRILLLVCVTLCKFKRYTSPFKHDLLTPYYIYMYGGNHCSACC